MRILELTAHIKSISRTGGRSATAAAAYRACARIVDERDGAIHDYRRKRGLEVAELVLPVDAPEWAADRSALWNAAELRERNGKRGQNAGQFKADAVVAREFLFAFPAELSAAGRLAVARTIARHLADTHSIAADFALHNPGAQGDERNHHCHMLTTTRRLTSTGLGRKAREWSDMKSGAALTRAFRAFVADTLNAALAEEGKGGLVHVEHRSLKARGSSRRPTRHQGPSKTNTQRKDKQRVRADWQRQTQQSQHERQASDRTTLQVRQEGALAAKLAHLADRERTGVAAIKAELARAQAADQPVKGARRLFEAATGQAMRTDAERQARMTQRVEAADRQIADLKATLAAERSTYLQAQQDERAKLSDRHGQEDRQLRHAFSTRAGSDRVAQVEARRREVQPQTREIPQHGHERSRTRPAPG